MRRQSRFALSHHNNSSKFPAHSPPAEAPFPQWQRQSNALLLNQSLLKKFRPSRKILSGFLQNFPEKLPEILPFLALSYCCSAKYRILQIVSLLSCSGKSRKCPPAYDKREKTPYNSPVFLLPAHKYTLPFSHILKHRALYIYCSHHRQPKALNFPEEMVSWHRWHNHPVFH